MRVIEMNEIGLELNDHTPEEWAEIEAQARGEWRTSRTWEIDEDTRLFEQRDSRNHLSVIGHFINEAANRERRDEAMATVFTAFTILNDPQGA